MLQAGRSRNAGGYRFGYQGQEADNKIGGLGQHLNYTFRNYDSWTIRFGAIDPLAAKYPHNSSYAFSEKIDVDIKPGGKVTRSREFGFGASLLIGIERKISIKETE